LMSYPRTEYSGIPTNLKDQVVEMLSKVHGKIGELNGGARLASEPLPDESLIRSAKVFDDSKIGDHYALMPTGDLAQWASINGDAASAFLMIYESVLCAVDAPAEYKEAVRTWTQENATGDYTPVKFTAKSKILTSAGWTRWQNKKGSNSELSVLTVSEENLNKAVVLLKKTSAPKPYNEATLLRAMETAGSQGYEDEDDTGKEENLISLMKGKGLGTPATRAEIIEGLKRSGYITLQKKNIFSTPRAQELIALVRERSPRLASPRETAEWEFELHKMEVNAPDALSRVEFLNRLKSEFEEYKAACIKLGIPASVGGSKSLDIMCPKSGKPIQEGGKFYKFPGYPKLACWKNLWGRDFTIEEWIQVIEAYMKAEELTFPGFSSKDGSQVYEGKVYLNGDRWAVESASSGGRPKETTVACPKSKEMIIESGKFFKAPGYPDRMLWKTSFGREMTPEIWVDILKASKKNPFKLEGCVSKAGNAYAPHVYFVGKNLKMEFIK
jgi:DNA topoisomerase-3